MAGAATSATGAATPCVCQLGRSTGVTADLPAAFGMACVPATTAAPGYTWTNAKIGGMGCITGLYAHPAQPGLFYSKTDAGPEIARSQ